MHTVYLSGDNYSDSDLPSNIYKYSSASIFVRNSSSIVVILYGVDIYPIMTNCYNGSNWIGWQTYAKTSDLDFRLNGLSKINFNIDGSQTLKIVEPNDRFLQILSIQGSQGELYGTFILNGYGIGGFSRYHVTTLNTGNVCEITIGDEGTHLFNLINSSNYSMSFSIVSLIGSMPTIS